MTSDATIDYEARHQEALRGLVRSVLSDVAKNGLPGEHHFYISYDVRSPGVALSKRLREKYPAEMTIVLQHRFWDLAVNDERFEVKLTFDGIPERLVVPFSAIKVFLDPSVRFVLHFEDAAALADREFPRDGEGGDAADGRPAGPRKRVPRSKPRAERTAGAPPLSIASIEPGDERRPAASRGRPAPLVQVPGSAGATAGGAPPAAGQDILATSRPDDTQPPSESGTPSNSGAQVLSLDAFRKK